eukprot:1452545-Alexandrium_andersonii.AAC.1
MHLRRFRTRCDTNAVRKMSCCPSGPRCSPRRSLQPQSDAHSGNTANGLQGVRSLFRSANSCSAYF